MQFISGRSLSEMKRLDIGTVLLRSWHVFMYAVVQGYSLVPEGRGCGSRERELNTNKETEAYFQLQGWLWIKSEACCLGHQFQLLDNYSSFSNCRSLVCLPMFLSPKALVKDQQFTWGSILNLPHFMRPLYLWARLYLGKSAVPVSNLSLQKVSIAWDKFMIPPWES